MKILVLALLALLFFAVSTKATSIPTSNASGQVSGSFALDSFGDFVAFVQTPQGSIAPSDGCCAGDLSFDPSTGVFGFVFSLVDGNSDNVGVAMTATVFEVGVDGVATVPAGFQPGSQISLSGQATITGEYVTQDLAGDEHIYTFTEPATWSADFEAIENPDGEVFINFSGGTPTPEPTSLILVVTGACFLVLRRSALLAQVTKR